MKQALKRMTVIVMALGILGATSITASAAQTNYRSVSKSLTSTSLTDLVGSVTKTTSDPGVWLYVSNGPSTYCNARASITSSSYPFSTYSSLTLTVNLGETKYLNTGDGGVAGYSARVSAAKKGGDSNYYLSGGAYMN